MLMRFPLVGLSRAGIGWVVVSVFCSLSVMLWLPQALRAQEAEGCCQFFARSDGNPLRRGVRRCTDSTRQQCDLLKASSSFFRGFRCDLRFQRCGSRLPSSAFTPTPTATPVPESMGCCQLDNVRRLDHSVCGNAMTQTSCLGDFSGSATFCANCVCSSHSDPGFTLDDGSCIVRPTPTPTPSGPRGCCQLDHLTGVRGSVCGNAISESTCLNDFPGDGTFCADCVCSSHTGPGFQFVSGTCVPPATPTRPRHNPHPPHRPAR